MKRIEDIVKELRRPFKPEAVHFKIQSVGPKAALVVAYIDARQTAERLNLVCPAQWSDEYQPADGGVECSIKLSPGGGGNPVIRTDVGISEGGIGGAKAIYSDAFKRAGVKFGIGACLYYTPRFYVSKNKLDQRGEKYFLSKEAETEARRAYAEWLEREGKKRFGEPLDMGEGIEDQGDIEVEPEGTPSDPELGGEDAPEQNVPSDKVVETLWENWLKLPGADWNSWALWCATEGMPTSFTDMKGDERIRAATRLSDDIAKHEKNRKAEKR